MDEKPSWYSVGRVRTCAGQPTSAKKLNCNLSDMNACRRSGKSRENGAVIRLHKIDQFVACLLLEVIKIYVLRE